MRRWFLNFCGALLRRKWKFKVLLASMKTHTNFEDPYWNPLRNACCSIQEAAYDSVNCSISRILRWKIQVLLFKITDIWLAVGFFKGWIEVSNSLWGAARVESDAASCKISWISMCFHRSKQELKKYFSSQLRCKENSSWHCPFKNILIRVRLFNTDPFPSKVL